MSDCLFPDLVSITPVTVNTETSSETLGTAFSSKAYWQESSRIRYSSDGQPLAPDVKLFLPSGTDIDFTYKISLTKKSGKTVKSSLSIDRKVKRFYPVGDDEESHIEVML